MGSRRGGGGVAQPVDRRGQTDNPNGLTLSGQRFVFHSVKNMGNGSSTHPKLAREIFHRDYAGYVLPSDVNHVLIGEFSEHSSFANRVPVVCQMIAKKQMVRVHARRIIASVANKKTLWYRSIFKHVGNPVSCCFSGIRSKVSVSRSVSGSCPSPASRFGFVDKVPKAFGFIFNEKVVRVNAEFVGACATDCGSFRNFPEVNNPGQPVGENFSSAHNDCSVRTRFVRHSGEAGPYPTRFGSCDLSPKPRDRKRSNKVDSFQLDGIVRHSSFVAAWFCLIANQAATSILAYISQTFNNETKGYSIA